MTLQCPDSHAYSVRGVVERVRPQVVGIAASRGAVRTCGRRRGAALREMGRVARAGKAARRNVRFRKVQ